MRWALSVILLLLIAPGFSLAAHPCSAIAKKCRKEGYAVGGANSSGQGVVKDCLEKVLAGQTLPGIDINFETLGACKVRYQQRLNASGDRPSRKISSGLEDQRSPKGETTGFIQSSVPVTDSAPKPASTGTQ